MTRPAIIIFVRNPESGKVKTRLASTIGNDAALKIYQKLLLHTREIVGNSGTHKLIFYAERITEDDLWSGKSFLKFLQTDGDLGERMKAAFECAFSSGFTNVLIIGSDCPELDEAIIHKGFEMLQTNDIVIGPARDGGYYLLGMKKLHPTLFENKQWSTEHIFSDTLEDINKLNLSVYKLPVLSDVDEEKDLPAEWLDNISASK